MNNAINLFYLFSIPIYWTFHRWNLLQKNYFVFGILSLYILTFFIPSKRKLNDIWIGLFLLISLSSVFSHNFYVGDFSSQWINFCLASEGFLYVLSGCLLYKLVYEYSEIKFLPLVWVSLIIWFFKTIITEHSFYTIISFSLSFLIFLYLKKKLLFAYILSFLGITFLLLNLECLWWRFQVRPFAWLETIKSIISHPFGQGFNVTLTGNVVYVNPYSVLGKFGTALGAGGAFIYPHNDYLNIMRDLGIIAIIPIIMYLISLFKYSQIHWLTFICLSVVILCIGNTTMYILKDAIVFIPAFAMLKVKNES